MTPEVVIISNENRFTPQPIMPIQRSLPQVYIFGQWLFYSLTMVGLLRLRITEPDMNRPFRVATLVPVFHKSLISVICIIRSKRPLLLNVG